MIDEEEARMLVALVTIVVTLGLVILDAMDPSHVLLTSQRLQLLFAFIGVMLGVGGITRRLDGLNVTFGKEEDDDDDDT